MHSADNYMASKLQAWLLFCIKRLKFIKQATLNVCLIPWLLVMFEPVWHITQLSSWYSFNSR